MFNSFHNPVLLCTYFCFSDDQPAIPEGYDSSLAGWVGQHREVGVAAAHRRDWAPQIWMVNEFFSSEQNKIYGVKKEDDHRLLDMGNIKSRQKTERTR